LIHKLPGIRGTNNCGILRVTALGPVFVIELYLSYGCIEVKLLIEGQPHLINLLFNIEYVFILNIVKMYIHDVISIHSDIILVVCE